MTEAPVEVWLRPGPTWDSYSTTAFPDQPDAVRYVRADLYEALQARLRAALESAEDNDVDGVERILRTALKLLPETDYR